MKKVNDSDSEDLPSKTRGLIFGRLISIFVLLLASWWWTNNLVDLSTYSFPDRLFLLFLLSICLTGLYYLFYKLSQDFVLQIRLQFLIDILLITWIVSVTGKFASPYVTLYIVLISVVGYFLGRRDTIVCAILSAGSFSFISMYSDEALIFSFTGSFAPSRFLQTIAFNNVGILIVGLLAGHFSDRRNVRRKLKETEESFADLNVLHERIVQSIPAGLITTDLSGKVRTVNRAAEEISGFSESEVTGESVYWLFSENIRPAVDLCLYRASESSEFPASHFESEIRESEINPRESGRSTVSCTIAPLIGKNGMVNGLILSFQDITGIRSMEQSLRQADRLAAIGRMAAGMAHEIRNPLGSMSSAMQFLEENVKPNTAEAELFEVVQRESSRLNEIISNFMAYARLSTGGLAKDKFESTDIRAAILDCLTLIRHSPEVTDGLVFNAVLPETDVRIMANQAQVKQVLWNLFQNAIHAMPDGGQIDITVRDFPGKTIHLIIEDSGIGISPENLEHIFEPFVSSSKGAGLGLSIVQNIVLDHGGSIEITSENGNGTKVFVELPY